MSHLGDRSTPDFIRLAVATSLQLIDLTTPSTFPLLHDDERQVIPTAALTQALSPLQSKSLSTRFLRLSTLLSSSLLGTVIMYTPTFPPSESAAPDPDPFTDPEHVDDDPVHVPEPTMPVPTPREQSFNPTLIAAAQSLPPVLSALGIGGIRFLKAIIPLLSEWLALPLPVVAAEIGDLSGDSEGVFLCDAEKS